jgi:molybdopterin synthase catalytic subunit
MNRFSLHETAFDPQRLLEALRHPSCGGYVTLEYEAFAPLALREGERILAAACARFAVERVHCAHRTGALEIGQLAVWVGVAAKHRGEAFDACRYIIDHVKHSVPIWKKEYYEDGDSGWVNCEHCAIAPELTAAPDPHPAHDTCSS